LIDLLQFGPSGVLGNFAYTLAWDDKLVIIDPISPDFEAFDQYIAEAVEHGDRVYLTNTHGHQDHVGHNDRLLELYPKIQYLDYREFREGELSLEGENTPISVVFTPGHYPDHISFCVSEQEQQAWILGDTLFHGGVGNCRSGSAKILYESVQNLKKLIDDDAYLFFSHNYAKTNLAFIQSLGVSVPEEITLLLKDCEHDYITTRFRDELLYNPFLQCESEQEFVLMREKRDQF
jgi:glyoxylase-like metal-dependent hydrolase (beta-lactamase superfamily II)